MAINSKIDSSNLYDVAIIGFGPTGAALANLLKFEGLRVIVFERNPGIFMLPRAVHFDAECMRVFQTIGIAEKLLPKITVSPGVKFFDKEEKLIIDWVRPIDVGRHGWKSAYKFHQPELEELLRKNIANDTVDVRSNHEVFSIEEFEEGVLLGYEDISNGKIGKISAKYVVGCDGARSLVRRFMGVELEDLKSHEKWVVVDVILDRIPSDLANHTTIQYCDPERPITYSPGPGKRRRWEIRVMPQDDIDSVQSEEWLWGQLARWITPNNAKLERSAIYTFHSVIAKQWRSGRLLIAGDAAHQTPPFMGQGLCAGIRDASNLGWKLSSVISGRSAESVLDSYGPERMPHVKIFIDTAVKFGQIIQSGLLDLDESNSESINLKNFRTPEPALGKGFYLEDDGGYAGKISAQPELSDGKLLDDKIGYQFAFVTKITDAVQLGKIKKEIGSLNIKLIADESPSVLKWLDEMAADGVLIRPDRYIYGVGRDLVEMIQLIKKIKHQMKMG